MQVHFTPLIDKTRCTYETYQLKENAVKALIATFLLLVTSTTTQANSTDVFTFTKTHCFGTCPAFEVNVFADGVISFHGQAYTQKEGVYRLPNNPELFNRIVQQLDEHSFTQFLDHYGWGEDEEESPCKELWTDASSTVITLQFANTKKTVYHYHGCIGFEREDELFQLEKLLFEMIGLKDYVGT